MLRLLRWHYLGKLGLMTIFHGQVSFHEMRRKKGHPDELRCSVWCWEYAPLFSSGSFIARLFKDAYAGQKLSYGLRSDTDSLLLVYLWHVSSCSALWVIFNTSVAGKNFKKHQRILPCYRKSINGKVDACSGKVGNSCAICDRWNCILQPAPVLLLGQVTFHASMAGNNFKKLDSITKLCLALWKTPMVKLVLAHKQKEACLQLLWTNGIISSHKLWFCYFGTSHSAFGHHKSQNH